MTAAENNGFNLVSAAGNMTLASTGNQKLKTLIERKCVSSMKTKGPVSDARGLSSRF